MRKKKPKQSHVHSFAIMLVLSPLHVCNAWELFLSLYSTNTIMGYNVLESNLWNKGEVRSFWSFWFQSLSFAFDLLSHSLCHCKFFYYAEIPLFFLSKRTRNPWCWSLCLIMCTHVTAQPQKCCIEVRLKLWQIHQRKRIDSWDWNSRLTPCPSVWWAKAQWREKNSQSQHGFHCFTAELCLQRLRPGVVI